VQNGEREGFTFWYAGPALWVGAAFGSIGVVLLGLAALALVRRRRP
jgi:hypothetical protein